METYVLLAIISMILFGINGIVYKIALEIHPVSLTLISVLSSTVIAFFYWWFFVPQKQVTLNGVGYGVLAGLISFAALVTMMFAFRAGNVSVVSTIISLGAAVTVFLAVVFLSEKLTLLQGIGIVFAIISVVLLTS